MDDNALLRKFADQRSEEAFAALVTRHIDKVYSVALRYTRNPHHAEEITQSVFVILAKKAPDFGKNVIVSGWLYQTARLAANTFVRGEIRRASREYEAYMQSTMNETESDVWPQIAPLLDNALAGLSSIDRHAIVLRFFDGRTMGEVGGAIGASEEAAKKRVNRAVEKLRVFFSKRGVVLPGAVLMTAITANSVQAAPIGLAATITTAATSGTVAAASITTLVKETANLMVWMKLKFSIGVGVVALLTGVAAALAVSTESPDNSTASEILLTVRNKYQSLSSYSDNGIATTKWGDITLTQNFQFRMQRPDFYKLEWAQSVASKGNVQTNKGMVWSAGAGHFVLNPKTERQVKDRGAALLEAIGNSNGATKDVPGAFFGDRFASNEWVNSSDFKREKDETLNGVHCYVLSGDVKEEMAGGVITVWIGKQNHLIHQSKRVLGVSDAEIKNGLERGNKPSTEKDIAAARELRNIPKPGEVIIFESHENISVNQKLRSTHFTR